MMAPSLMVFFTYADTCEHFDKCEQRAFLYPSTQPKPPPTPKKKICAKCIFNKRRPLQMYIIERRESHLCGVWVQNQQMSNWGYVAGIQANFRNINNCQLLSLTGIGPCVFHIIYRASQKCKIKFFEVWQLLCPKVPRVPKSAQKCPECPKMSKSD